MTRYVGVDLHRRRSVIVVLDGDGTELWTHRIDNSPVIQYQERKSISTERTFDRDTTDVTKLKTILTAMAQELTYQLRNGNKLTACVSVKIRYSDFQTYTMQRRIPYSASDHSIFPVVFDLFRKLYQRRLLVRLIGVNFSHLVEGGHQAAHRLARCDCPVVGEFGQITDCFDLIPGV